MSTHPSPAPPLVNMSNRSVIQSVSANERVGLLSNEAVNESVSGQSVSQSADQTSNQSTNKPISQSIN